MMRCVFCMSHILSHELFCTICGADLGSIA
jgi:rRNA maturation endonuclease Nob1